jgi:hypothetical protein
MSVFPLPIRASLSSFGRVSIFVCSIGMALAPLHAELSTETFLNPPLQSRPSALWTWMNAHVDRQQLTHELEEMKDKGMRGAIIWDMGTLQDPEKIIPVGPPFLGPESVANIHHVIDEADRLGLEIGLSAASSWNAGGPWVKSEDACQTLAWASMEVTGPKAVSTELPVPEKAKSPTTTLAVIAIPSESTTIAANQSIRLDDRIDADGKLNWSAPEGKWTILHFVSTATGQQLMCPSPNSKGLMVDHLSAQATRNHLNHVFEAITKDRKDLGALHTLFLDSYEVKTPIDWTPKFTAVFEETYGYDPLPWLPVLAGMTVTNEDLSNRFRHDYGRLVSDLVIENHFSLAREIVNKHGLKLLAEAGHGGYARFDPLKALGAADIPMGEFWNHRKNWCVKEAASAANLYSKPLVNAESMTGWQHWQDGPQMYKRLTDIAFCAGLNQITFHTFAHQPPGSGLPGYAYHAGEHFNVNLTWWPQARPMLDTLSRSCHMLQQGRFVADVCAYYGNGAPNLVPARRIAPTDKPQWTEDKCLHCGQPHPVDLSTLGQGHDYDYLNEEILVEKMQVRDGKLTLPNGMEYRLLVLPTRSTISLTSLTKIEQLVREGATVAGPKPTASNSMHNYPDCDTEVRTIADRIWGKCDGETVKVHSYGKGQVVWNVPISEVLSNLNVAPDFTAEGIDNAGRKIDYIHRTTGDEEIYFICNSTEETLSFSAEFRVGNQRTPFFWNPEDGSTKPCLQYTSTKDSTHIPLTLEPTESLFVVFSSASTKSQSEHVTKILHTRSDGAVSDVDSEIVSVESNRAQILVSEAGTYTVTTSSGAKGSIAVDSVPPSRSLDGPWDLEFEPKRGAPAKVTMDPLTDWTKHSDPGVRYFSGTATYHKSISIDEATASQIASGHRIQLNLGDVHETAVVSLNGKEITTLWKFPYTVDVTQHLKTGDNALTIAVTNVWNNRLVGDAQRDDDTDITRTNMHGKFKANSPLLPSGIVGPVTLETRIPASIDLKR